MYISRDTYHVYPFPLFWRAQAAHFRSAVLAAIVCTRNQIVCVKHLALPW